MFEGHDQDGVFEYPSLGDLADDMVSALGRVERHDPPRQGDTAAVQQALGLFELMANDDILVMRPGDAKMLNDGSYLSTLRVVEQRTKKDSDVRKAIAHIADLLRKLRDEGLEKGADPKEIEALRDLFLAVSSATLSQATENDRRREPTWRTIPETSMSTS